MMIKYLGLIDKVGLPKRQCLIFGSAVLAARGLDQNKDLDIAVPLSLFVTIASNPTFKLGYATASGTKVYTIEGGKLEIFPSAWPLKENVSVLLQRADDFHGYKLMHLEDYKRWLKLRGRPKDIERLKLL